MRMALHAAIPPDPRKTCGDHCTDPGLSAIALALTMNFDTAEDCFRWLYDYGVEPLTPARGRAADAGSAVLTLATRARLTHRFHHAPCGNWHVWSRDPTAETPPVSKAYLNPRFVDLARLELRAGRFLDDPRIAAFKTVAQRWMALRSDKIMVYFHAPSDRASWIADTIPGLAGLVANPVPFTTRADPAGLITTATDPVDLPGQSWRSWLLRLIATQVTRRDHPDLAAVQSALRGAGVDPATWQRSDHATQ